MTDPADDLPNEKEYSAAIRALMDHYLAHGCPCRFPRFRATCARDTAEVGVPDHTTAEQQELIAVFDRAVPRRSAGGDRSRCARCGATIDRRSVEQYRDVYSEYLRIKPAKGVADIGAPVDGRVPRVCDFSVVARPSRAAENIVAVSYPQMPWDEWLAWMRELKSGAPTT